MPSAPSIVRESVEKLDAYSDRPIDTELSEEVVLFRHFHTSFLMHLCKEEEEAAEDECLQFEATQRVWKIIELNYTCTVLSSEALFVLYGSQRQAEDDEQIWNEDVYRQANIVVVVVGAHYRQTRVCEKPLQKHGLNYTVY